MEPLEPDDELEGDADESWSPFGDDAALECASRERVRRLDASLYRTISRPTSVLISAFTASREVRRTPASDWWSGTRSGSFLGEQATTVRTGELIDQRCVAKEMAEVIRSLQGISDIVLLDLPPIVAVTDALVVASITWHVLVIGPKSDTRPTLITMRQQLDRVGADIIGALLNGPHASMTQTYYSY